MLRPRFLVALLFAALALPVAARSDVPNAIVHWNTVAADAFTPTQGTNPMAQSRTLAIVHASMHDALNAIEPRFAPYTPGLPPAPGASVDAAAAAAARDVLVTLVPDQRELVEAAYHRALASVADPAARDAGVALGQAAARATLARRSGDGFEQAAQPAYVPGRGPAQYQFTPPFDFAALPWLGNVRPFVIDLRAHTVPGPLSVSSARYASDLAIVKQLGAANSTTRTADQSEIAKFWYEDSPLGWNRIANSVIAERGLDPWSSARAFALLNFAMADGFIAGFDAKYRYRFWRPVTAIHDAATDGNPRTEADRQWQPFLITPPVPDHPSTHTVLGWAAAEVLIAIFGDDVRYSATSLTLPEVKRSYTSFSAAAEENGWSRVYAGIHFPYAVAHGRRQGQSIGRSVARALAPSGPARIARH